MYQILCYIVNHEKIKIAQISGQSFHLKIKLHLMLHFTYLVHSFAAGLPNNRRQSLREYYIVGYIMYKTLE